jgi:hypothetical protein
MYEKFQNKTSPSLIVEALFYKEDGSNQSEVVAFLSSRIKARAIAAEGTTVVIRFGGFRANDYRIYPGFRAVAYPDKSFAVLTQQFFDANYHPLPTGGHYVAKTDGYLKDALVVEAHYYLPDESNAVDVRRFLDNRLNRLSISTSTVNHKTGASLPAIGAVQDRGDSISTTWVYPGQVAIVHGEDPTVVFALPLDRFHDLYIPVELTKFPSPLPVEEKTKPVYHDIQTYRRLSETQAPFTVYAMQYEPERNYILLRDMLSPYGDTFQHLHDTTALFLHDPRYIEVFNAPKDSTVPVTVRPGDWVTITRRDNELPHFCIYSTSVFRTIFTPHDFTKKVTMPAEKADHLYKADLLTSHVPAESDYSKNLSSVYDALAILRVNPREQDFEFAAKEIMELLAYAYNEGFALGLTTAETNPYQN